MEFGGFNKFDFIDNNFMGSGDVAIGGTAIGDAVYIDEPIEDNPEDIGIVVDVPGKIGPLGPELGPSVNPVGPSDSLPYIPDPVPHSNSIDANQFDWTKLILYGAPVAIILVIIIFYRR